VSIGCHELAEVQENIVTAFTEIGSDDNNRVTAILNGAYRVSGLTLCAIHTLTSIKRARQGKYRQALAMLLKPDVWRGLSSANYLIWANQLWHILMLRASRRCVDSSSCI
jgi:anaphase-promoting complex subunit 5